MRKYEHNNELAKLVKNNLVDDAGSSDEISVNHHQ